MSNNRVTWVDVIQSMSSDDIKRIAEEQGKSYSEVEKTLNAIVKESQRGKAYRDKARQQMREIKSAILK